MNETVFIRTMEQGSTNVAGMLLPHYASLGITEQEMMIVFHIEAFQKEGVTFPTPEQFAGRMSLTEQAIVGALRSLLQREVVQILESESEEGIRSEAFSLTPVWKKLYHHLNKEEKKANRGTRQDEEAALYRTFEEEFARPLSPMETETLSMWLDHDAYDPPLIRQALKEAVLSGKMHFRYIDRILFDWQKQGVRTVQQAQAKGRQVRMQARRPTSSTQSEQPKSKNVPLYNWLEQ
ncbi:DnaD domain-containing protein [Bacillus fonticola]|uniref:DnaD domain-containing protein n=1 Tax=Bacillus fonticola TaxID=2728853 RepID=UPI001475D87A|nr:DnaD domain-containing protein [Bacillus fonticola]